MDKDAEVIAETAKRAEAIENAEETERRQNAKLFDIRALAASTRRFYGVNVEGLGIVRYGLLTEAELKAVKLVEGDNAQRIYQIVCAMLRKADPSLPQKDIDDLPYDVKALLVSTLLKRLPSFLLATRTKSKIGLKRTQKLKK